MNILDYAINEEIKVKTSPTADKIEKVGIKRNEKEEAEKGELMSLEGLIELLSEMRVYLRERYGYCIQCKIPNIDKDPCKHCH